MICSCEQCHVFCDTRENWGIIPVICICGSQITNYNTIRDYLLQERPIKYGPFMVDGPYIQDGQGYV